MRHRKLLVFVIPHCRGAVDDVPVSEVEVCGNPVLVIVALVLVAPLLVVCQEGGLADRRP